MTMHRAIPALLLLLSLAAVAPGRDDVVPPGLQDVGVDEHPNAQVPLDAKFLDESGRQVTLRDCLLPGRPAILQLSYFGCPMLCDLVSQGMVKSLQDLDLQLGHDFAVINISFDQRESSKDAYDKKQGYLRKFDGEGVAGGWHFLTGPPESVAAVSQAVGFNYKWVEESKQFSHAAVLLILTPDGRVSRYLYGVEFPQKTLRLSLIEASDGKIGTTLDQVLMFCFHYSPGEGRYTLAATRIVRLGGILTIIGLGGSIGLWLLKERRARRVAAL